MPRLVTHKVAWIREQLRGVPYVAIDTETTGVGFYDEPFCVTLSWRPDPESPVRSAYISLERHIGGCHDSLRDVLQSVPKWVFHNAKFDLQKLVLVGILNEQSLDAQRLEDTQTIYHLLDENDRKGLKYLARKILKEETDEEEVLKVVRRKLKLTKDDGYQYIPRHILQPYAMKDTEFTLRLWEILRPRLEKRGEDLVDLYRSAMRGKLVLLRMEANGFALDMEYLDRVTSEYGAAVMQGWQNIVALTGKPDLNPNSPAQLIEAFADMHLYVGSTAKEALREVADRNTKAGELAALILCYREDAKIHKTYLRGLQNEQRNGIIHPSFNDDAAKTGRMSSSTPSNNE
jgi:DNA polymerase-1